MTVHQGYNAILPDLMLPRLDGMTLCRKLRQDFLIATPIIMLTARNPADDRVEGFAPGADNYLAPPSHSKSWMPVSRRWCAVRKALISMVSTLCNGWRARW